MTTQWGRNVDSQKSKLYGAEGVSPSDRSTQRKPPVLTTVADIEAEVWAILRDPRVTKEWPGVARVNEVHIHDGGGSRRGYCHNWGSRRVRLTMPLFARTEPILIHELSHFLTDQFAVGSAAPHGPEFAANYVKLIHIRMGAKASAAVKRQFRRAGVRFAPKRKMSPAQLEAARAGMEAMRNRAASQRSQP